MQQNHSNPAYLTLAKPRPLQVLFIEDNHADTVLIKRLLRDAIAQRAV